MVEVVAHLERWRQACQCRGDGEKMKGQGKAQRVTSSKMAELKRERV